MGGAERASGDSWFDFPTQQKLKFACIQYFHGGVDDACTAKYRKRHDSCEQGATEKLSELQQYTFLR